MSSCSRVRRTLVSIPIGTNPGLPVIPGTAAGPGGTATPPTPGFPMNGARSLIVTLKVSGNSPDVVNCHVLWYASIDSEGTPDGTNYGPVLAGASRTIEIPSVSGAYVQIQFSGHAGGVQLDYIEATARP